MVDVDKAVIARINKNGKHFEILVDCDKAVEYKAGKGKIDDVTATKGIFNAIRSAELATEASLNQSFGTTDVKKIADIIIKEGEIQLTTEYKHKLREEKKKQIITLIQRNAINPQNNLPHPPSRIEAALDEARVKIDEFKRAEEQLDGIVKRLVTILPLRFETRKLKIVIPAQYGGQSYHVIKTRGKLIKDSWNPDGSLSATIEIPAGMQEDLENVLNSITHGEATIELQERKGER
ncbi:MAG: ribosome assembly factor SBDS [Nanoarchaeota archaeon]